MAALNHIIIPAKDKDASAKFLASILGIEPRPQWGPFRPVQTSNGVTLTSRMTPDLKLRTGQQIEVAAAPDRLYFFDPKTEDKVA